MAERSGAGEQEWEGRTAVRIGLIIRPWARQAEQEEWRLRIAVLRERGHEVWPRLTFESGDARRQARGLARRGADLVVAVGGDGTVNEVVNGLARTEWGGALAVIPQGTANDFAAGLGIPEGVESSLEVALSGTRRLLDLGRVNGRYFANMSTGGFGAESAEEASPEAKRLLGPWAYVATGVKEFVDLTPSRARFCTPSRELYDGEVTLFAVGNGKRTGGGNYLTPRAEPDDGELDLLIVPGLTRLDFLALIPELRSGSHLDDPSVLYFRTTRLRVESESELSMNTDGEPMRGKRFTYGLEAGRLAVMTPAV
jgi:diacylglycerol kinase (ATP)